MNACTLSNYQSSWLFFFVTSGSNLWSNYVITALYTASCYGPCFNDNHVFRLYGLDSWMLSYKNSIQLLKHTICLFPGLLPGTTFGFTKHGYAFSVDHLFPKAAIEGKTRMYWNEPQSFFFENSYTCQWCNFVITGDIGGCRCGAASDDIVGFITTFGFRWRIKMFTRNLHIFWAYIFILILWNN